MEEYILIFRHEDGGKIASSEQIQIWMKQTQEWITNIAVQDKFVQGIGFTFGGAQVVFSGGKVIEGPFGAVKETVGGCIIVKAESVEEAVAFAKGCPVLQGEGNSVEVRKIAKH